MADTQVRAVVPEMTQPAIERLKAQIDGRVTLPADEQYDEVRKVWNGMIDRYPAILVHCTSTSDVVAAVHFAREHDLLVAVRGGGHNVAGHATVDGGIVIDLSPMKEIQVDPENRSAQAAGGVTWGELDAAAQPYGLATPGGVFSGTGIAGLTLGGGFGWLCHKYGMSCDNLIGAELVTARGEVLEVNAESNPDLLWGLRGGGGNFGIVTRFTFQLHPVGPEVMMTFVLHNAEGENMKRAITFYRDFVQNAPEEISSLAAIGVIPPHGEMFPEEIHGTPFVLFGAVYAGPADAGQRVLQPLRDFDEPLADFSGVMPYVEAQKMFDEEYPDGMRYYWKSLSLNRLDDEVMDTIIEHARRQPSDLSTIDLWAIGGAIRRGGPEDSAFFGREAPFLINPEANWEDPADDEANITWARDLIAAMEPYSDGSRYLNFAGFQEEGDAMMESAYGPYYQRLVDLKTTYDPENFFRLNQNVKPRGSK